MVNQKVTPEIIKFINSNHKLTATELSGIIEKRFSLKITSQAVNPYVVKARADAAEKNNAKVEAVRSKILDDADKWANVYLQYTHDEIESLLKLIKASDGKIKLESPKDRMAASQALHRMLSTIIDFVKPEPEANLNINIKPDLSKLNDAELDDLDSLVAKVTRSPGDKEGESKATPS